MRWARPRERSRGHDGVVPGDPGDAARVTAGVGADAIVVEEDDAEVAT
jgi:hypothetical protein